MDDKQDKPRKGCIARFFGTIFRTVKWTLIFGLLAGVGYVVWVHYEGRQAAEQMRQKILDYGLTTPLPTFEIPNDKNAARYWLAAMAMTIEPGRAFYDSIAWPDFGERFAASDMPKLRDFVQLNQPAYDLVDSAMTMDQCDLGLDIVDDFDKLVPIWSKCRRLSYAIGQKVSFAIASDQPQLAVDSCIQMLAVADVLQANELIISQLVRVSLLAGALNRIEELLGCLELNEHQLDLLLYALEKRAIITFKRAYEGELRYGYAYTNEPYRMLAMHRKVLLQMHCQLKLDQNYPFYKWEYVEVDTPQKWWDQCVQYGIFAVQDLAVGKKQLEMAKDFDKTLMTYELLKKPGFSWDEFQKHKDEVGTNFLTIQTFFQNTVRKQTFEVALKVEKFRVKYGRWPLSMDEAFATLPEDALGQPFQMSVINDVLRVYTIGLDGVDHQGLGQLENMSEYEHQDDIAFRLLDPKQRNQKPKPKPEPVVPEDSAPNLFE